MGARWAGKSSSANTILGEEGFEHGRVRTMQCEVRHGEVNGQKLKIVDCPGFKELLSDTSEPDKQQIKLSVTKCLPGPHVVLLAVPADTGFTEDRKQLLVQHMKLFGDRVWRYVIVLFTCGDYLDEGTSIEDHIKNEGKALTDVLGKCENRYHVFDNRKKSITNQVPELLQKIGQLVEDNHAQYYEVDRTIVQRIEEKRSLMKENAARRKLEYEKQREQSRKALNIDSPIPEVRIVLLGNKNAGKTSTMNTILGMEDLETGRTTNSVVTHGHVGQTAVTIVDTPGWRKSFTVVDTTERIKQELMRSPFLCSPGPHVFLLVIDIDASFTEKHVSAAQSHLELLGNIWKHIIVVFSGGDWLGVKTIEEHIEGEGKALQSLVNKCNNRYHVFDNRNTENDRQVTELLQKIKEMVAVNAGEPFHPDKKISKMLQQKRAEAEKFAARIQTTVKAQTQELKKESMKLSEIRIILLGQKTVGKSAAGNTILEKEVFSHNNDQQCVTGEGEVAGRKITVVDTPGWENTLDWDQKIVKGVSLCPPGPHAFLLVVPLDLALSFESKRSLEDCMSFFGEEVWRHTIVLFTFGDRLEDQTIEEHIQREHPVLTELVERCGHRYHVLNNKNIGQNTQVLQLLEKIEQMVAANQGQYFHPDMAMINKRVQEKYEKRDLNKFLLEKCNRRELELKDEFRRFLCDLLDSDQSDTFKLKTKQDRKLPGEKELVQKIKPLSLLPRSKESKKNEEIQRKIEDKIKRLDEEIKFRGSALLIPPSISDGHPAPSTVSSSRRDWNNIKPKTKFGEVLKWLSKQECNKDHPTVSSETSDYKTLSSVSLFAQSEAGKT
ncbi:GTPase IMAP family member 8-like [Chanos chanos]|uniref:GTPase IMAP family member 8-like n=1 Tax=Chanos chanos TaxID=29144 RepID=A0A6J2VTR1_CHACN|nr:GTPase IMAP family member 8-like [Chanos chanos]